MLWKLCFNRPWPWASGPSLAPSRVVGSRAMVAVMKDFTSLDSVEGSSRGACTMFFCSVSRLAVVKQKQDLK